MSERRGNPWPIIALATALLVLVIGWFVWEGRSAPGDVARTAARVVPDLQPRLPESPRLPDAPIPVPK